MDFRRLFRLLKEYLVISIACFIFAYAWEGFMIPNGMSAGGVMGLCTVVQYATDGMIPAQYSYFAINAVLLVVAILAMGISFGFKTIYCIVFSSVAMGVIQGMPGLFSVEGSFFYVQERVLIPVIAGALEALGIGLVLRQGGSTGGTDIVALMVNKYWPVSLSKAFLVMDLVVIALLLALPDKSFTDMVYGIVEVITFSAMIDFVVGGEKSSYQLLVFSKRYDTIADHINNVMDRGVTVLKAQGWFTKQEKNVLLILISKKELPSLTRVIKDADPNAFMSVSPAGNVYGEGFEEIKTGLRGRKKSNS